MLKIFRIKGFSLFPLFKEGEVVFCLKIFSFTKIKLNDIVIFKHEIHGLMIKKVVRISDDNYFVKGESIDSIDSRDFGELKRKDFLFKVLFKIPFGYK